MENNMVDKLKSMLDNPETMNVLSSILGSMQSPSQQAAQNTPEPVVSADNTEITLPEPPPPSQNDFGDSMIKIKQMLDNVSTGSDPRINLLTSLKPYMGAVRATKMDQAIRLIQLSKMASIFKL